MKLKELILYAIFGVLIFALKLVMASLPNIEPVTLLVILSAICFNKRGYYVLFSYVLLEILIYGIGLWSVGYLYIWLILFMVSRAILNKDSSVIFVASIAAIFGLLFGAFYIPVYCIAGCVETSLTWWIAGIPYDLVHGISNFIIVLICFNPLKKVLLTLQTKYLN